jgi:hypothetical protein
VITITLENRLKGTYTTNSILGEDGKEYSISLQYLFDKQSDFGRIYLNKQPVTFTRLDEEDVDLGLGPVSFKNVATDIRVDEESLPAIGDGILTILGAEEIAHVEDFNGGLIIPVDYKEVTKRQFKSHQRVTYTPVHMGKFMSGKELKPIDGKSSGVLHYINHSTNGIIILESGGLVNLDFPSRNLIGNAYRFEHGMKVTLDYKIKPEGCYPLIENNLFAYNINLDESFEPKYMGVVGRDSGNSQITDVVSKYDYEFDTDLPKGTLVNFWLSKRSSKERRTKGFYKVKDIEPIDKIPYGAHSGTIKEISPNWEKQTLASSEFGELPFWRDTILHFGDNYWPVINKLNKRGAPLRFDVIGTGDERLATNIVLDLSIPYGKLESK